MDCGKVKVKVRGGFGIAGLLCFTVGWMTSSVSGGTVVYVNQTAKGTNDGTGWTDAYTDLQAALDAAEASGGAIREIWVAAGTYRPSKRTNPDDPRSPTFQLIVDVSLYGGFAGIETSTDERNIDANETILSGDIQSDDSPEVSDCCRVHQGTGCEDVACQTTVCSVRSDCCSESWNRWTASCVQFATDLCSDPCNLNDNAYHVVDGSNSQLSALMDGFTITAGRSNGSGGGMYVYAAAPTIANCTFLGNSAIGGGGGFYNYSGWPTLTNCTFLGNSAGSGGGMLNHGGAPPLTNCTFSGNSASTGGGMVSANGSETLTNCTFSGNSAIGVGDGGGLYNASSRPTLNNCTFNGNSAYSGGGMANSTSNPTLTNCTFRGNSATFGAGMKTFGNSPTLTNCTFTGNSANVFGGGIYHDQASMTLTNCTLSGNSVGPGINVRGGGIYNSSGNPKLANCILWGNRERSNHGESAQIFVFSGTPDVRYCDVEGWTGGLGGQQNWSDDPLFVDADGPDNIVGTLDDNLRLKFYSPCIDTGLNTAVLVTIDADGKPRIVDGDGDGTATVDRGAYEFSCATDEECNDTDPCTIDECDVPLGVCINLPVECPQGQVCLNGQCVDFCDVANCNDYNVCTLDSCDAQTMQCVNTPNFCPEGVIFVNAKAEGANDGSSWTDAYTDLQPALDAAEASGGAISDIWIAAGTYKPSKRTIPDDPRSATFQLIDGVSLFGGFAGFEASIDERDIDANETILSGDINGDDGPDFTNYDENAYHVVSAIGIGTSTIFDGLTVRGGYSQENASGYENPRWYGGGMFLINSSPEIRDCTFTRNLAEPPEWNTAWSGGGGAALFLYQQYAYPPPPPLKVSRSRFTDNNSTGDGAAVFLWGAYEAGGVNFSECSFERNVGNGAFSASGMQSQTFCSCTFSDNSSDRWGGAISDYYGSGELLIEQCRFEGNTAQSGGAIYWRGWPRATIRNSVFLNNSAKGGTAGALYLSDTSVEIADCEFQGNSAQFVGGAFLDAYPSTPVRRCQFVDNWATDGEAGGLYVRGSAFLSECNFVRNHARSHGGGLYSEETLRVSDSKFVDNYAWDWGGAAFASWYKEASFEDTEFYGNRADYGGAISIFGGRAILDRCRIARNEAAIGGGVAAFDSRTDLQLVSTLFADNQADAYGGGIAAGDGELTAHNCTIINNTAGALGGGMIVGRDATIANSIIWGNVVDPGGESWTDEVAQIDGIEFADIQHSDVQGWSGDYGGDGNIGLDPLFVDPVDPDGYYGPMEADYRLQVESPCINAGMTKDIDWSPWKPPPPNLDLDGKPRTLCGQIDMGAYEFGLPGDVDCDRTVDLDDFANWYACMTGPLSATFDVAGALQSTINCSAFDLDGDEDVDLADFARFSWIFSPNAPNASLFSKGGRIR